MPTWLVVLLATIGWLVLALVVGMVLGAVIRRRDRQVDRPDDDHE
ncbi:MAG TPA: hypothetical protein VFE65_12075 [Pseudonocardia sp.]|nr:hypothetical protein [Pseudonocardia sp.]